MAEDTLDRFERLFRAAQMHPPAERIAFLDAACSDDPALRRELESLLTADGAADGEAFLDAPAAARAPDLLGGLPEGDTLVGSTVGPYAVLRPLGQGGMGDVYLARRDEPFRRHVALKVIRRGTDTREVLARFEMERQILAALDHPNIARLLDGGVTDAQAGPGQAGLPYFAMEFIEGRPITQYCDEQRLPIDERLRLFAQVCEAVHYAHQNLILHRDLKPTNILVTTRGEVKLLDFGIAKLLNPHLSQFPVPVTRIEQRVMTPEYASPEQVNGEILTTASDVYSLGVLLYEMLTGRPPYELAGRTTPEIVQIVCEQHPLRPSTVAVRPRTASDEEPDTVNIAAVRASTPDRLRRHLRGDLDNIVLMALRKEPSRRYASAEQFGEDVGRYLDGRPVIAHRDSGLYRLGKFIRRNRAVSVLVLLVMMSILGGLGTALWLAGDARRERDRAEAALAESEQVRAFLVDLFRASDPREVRGGTMTVTELLEHGVAQADRLKAQPIVQAEVFEAVGEVYFERGEFARSEALLARTLALRQGSLGADHPHVAEAMLALGHAMRSQGRYAEAEALYRQALVKQQEHYGDGHPIVAQTLDHVGGVRTYQGDLVGAEALYRQALAMRRAVLAPDDPAIAGSLRLIAVTLRRRGDAEGAAAYYREALALLQRRYGQEDQEVVSGLLHLGDQYVNMGRMDEAESLFRRALRIVRTTEDSDPQNIVHGLHSLAALLEDRKQFDEAEALRYEALDFTRQLYGERSWRAAAERADLGNHFRRRGRLDEAEARLQEAIGIYDEVFHPSQRYAMAARAALAKVYEERGEHRRAEASYREMLALREQAEGEGSMVSAIDRARLANVLVLQGRFAEAETLYHQALRIYQPQIADAHVDVQTVLQGLVTLYEREGKSEAASRYRQRLITPAPPGE